MTWRRLAGKVGRAIRRGTWWVTIGPFCWATDLPELGASPAQPLYLGSQPDSYPVTELLGRLLSFRSRLRLVRAVLILCRAILLCAIVILLTKIGELITHQPPSAWVMLALFLVVLWASHLALNHVITPFDVARLVDRRLALHAQTATAVEYTLRDRLDRPLARTQVRVATNGLRDLDPNQAIPFLVPGRDLEVLGLVGGLLVLVSVVGTLGITLPRPLQPIEVELAKQASQEVQAPTPFIRVDATGAPLQSAAAPLANPPIANGAVSDQLNSLRQQLQAQQITPEQYQQELKQVQQQIASQATQSLSAQEALNALAAALRDSSATQAISASLMNGDYSRASQQLTELSKQLGQLSPEARQELADRLAQASTQTQRSNQAISRDTGQASSALKSGNLTQASQALQSLAQSVQQASNQIAAQSQLGQEMQDVQRQLGDRAGNDSNQGSSSANSTGQPDPGESNASGAPDGRPGATSDRNGSPGSSDQFGSGNGSTGDPTGSGQAAIRSSSADVPQDESGNSGGVGSSSGGSPLGAGSSTLDNHGVKLTILGKSSGTGPATTSAGDRSVPLTAAGDSSLNGLAGSGSVPSNVPINVHQESNVVPLDRKPVVREYFSDGTQ